MERWCIGQGTERGPSKTAKRPGFRRGSKDEEFSGDGESRGSFKKQDLSFVLCCYHFASSPLIPPLLPVPSEAPDSPVHASSVLRKGREMGHHPCQHGCGKESKKPGTVDIDPSQSGRRNKGAHPGKGTGHSVWEGV